MGNLSRQIVFFICCITGLSALLYEVCWQKYLANLLGSSSRGTTLTLSVFLLGLGIGYYLFGKLTQRRTSSSLVRWYGFAEIAIGVWGAIFLVFYEFAWSNIGILPLEQPIPLLYDFLLSCLAIGPATILMGATLPLLTQAFCSDDNSEKEHALLYAINTAGAGVGALLGGLILIPSLGLFETNCVAIALNLIFGVMILLVAPAKEDPPPSNDTIASEAKPDQRSLSTLFPYCIIALLIGFVGLSLQSISFRILGLSIGSSEATFSFVVASYIFLSAFGAWIFAKKEKAPLETVLTVLVISLIALQVAIPYFPYLFHLVRIQFESTPESFSAYYFTVFLTVTAILAIPVAAIGSVLPLLVLRSKTKESIGEAVGYIYATNTLGSIIGVFSCGYFLYFNCNLQDIYSIIVVTTVLLCILTYIFFWSQESHIRIYAAPTLCLIATLTLPSWGPQYLGFGIFREREATAESYLGRDALYNTLLDGASVIYQNDSADTSITIAEFKEDELKTGVAFSRSIVVNGKSDGNTLGDKRTMRLLGHLPGLLRPSEGPVAVVGYGTGMTVGSLLRYENIPRVDVIEIESATKEFAPYFDFANNNVTKSNRVAWHFNDAYRVLGGSNEKYSAIISQPSNPWLSGIERLYSLEFHTIVKEKLKKDGIYIHWFPLHDLSPESIALILNTMKKTFRHIRIFKSGFDIIVSGSNFPLHESSMSTIAKRFHTPAIKKDLEEIGIPSLQYLFGLEQWLSPELYKNDAHHSLLRPKLGSMARKDFFINKTARLQLSFTPPKRWYENYLISRKSLLNSWLQHSQQPPALTDLLRAGCGSVKIQLVEPNWRYIRSICRDTALRALIEKNLQPPKHIAGEIEWLKIFLTASDESPKIQPTDEIIKDLALFAQFDSILMPLSENVLMKRAQTCLIKKDKEHLFCRLQLLKTLTYTGRSKLAKTLIENFMHDTKRLGEKNTQQLYLTELATLENLLNRKQLK